MAVAVGRGVAVAVAVAVAVGSGVTVAVAVTVAVLADTATPVRPTAACPASPPQPALSPKDVNTPTTNNATDRTYPSRVTA
ncbi:MAG: hypothetical protein JW384_01248 [Nitrosomonadaceae bacterium]|nr:hypothetical protein [Nitrosomonadaceae bacterium]